MWTEDTGGIPQPSLSQPSGEPPPRSYCTPPNINTSTLHFFSLTMKICLSASCMTSHCSHIFPSLVSPFPGELYSRDSKNSCITKNWCQRLPTPQCFQRDGCKLGPADRPLNRSTPGRGSTEL